MNALDQLRDDLALVTLDRPAEQVLQRGDRLRRRRRRARQAGAVSVLTVGLAVTGTVLQTGIHRGEAYAAWTSVPEATDPATAARIDASCRSMGITDDLPLRVLDRRGSIAFSVYTDGARIAECSRFRGSENLFREGGTSGGGEVTAARKVAEGQPVALEGTSGATVGDGSSLLDAFGWVASDVDHVVIRSEGFETTATLTRGLFSGWWPAEVGAALPAVTVTAYDAADHVLGVDQLPGG